MTLWAAVWEKFIRAIGCELSLGKGGGFRWAEERERPSWPHSRESRGVRGASGQPAGDGGCNGESWEVRLDGSSD